MWPLSVSLPCFSRAPQHRYAAHNYHSVPVVIARGKDVHVWDVDGKRYLDALSGYSAVNQARARALPAQEDARARSHALSGA